MVFINTFIQNSLFIRIPIIIERKRKLLHLPEAVDDTNGYRLPVGRCGDARYRALIKRLRKD